MDKRVGWQAELVFYINFDFFVNLRVIDWFLNMQVWFGSSLARIVTGALAWLRENCLIVCPSDISITSLTQYISHHITSLTKKPNLSSLKHEMMLSVYTHMAPDCSLAGTLAQSISLVSHSAHLPFLTSLLMLVLSPVLIMVYFGSVWSVQRACAEEEHHGLAW